MDDIRRKRIEKGIRELIKSVDSIDLDALMYTPPVDRGELRASWPTPRRCSQCKATLPEESRSKTCGNLLCAMTQADEETR